MDKFYYEATEDTIGTRICIGDTVILDADGAPDVGDIVLISIRSEHVTKLRIFNGSYPSDIVILGRVTESLVRF
jgi:SOS-response transcriptional repressor LexA